MKKIKNLVRYVLQRKFPRYLFFFVQIALLILFSLLCQSNTETSSFDANREKLLMSISANVIIPLYKSFHLSTNELRSNLEAYETSVKNDDNNKDAKLMAAKSAWKKAMKIWQEIEITQFGPAGASGKRFGGQDLRDEIYSWPTSNPCKVDTFIVQNNFSSDTFITSNLVNSYGLDALEYLLFNTSAGNKCPISATINTDGSWSALTPTDKKQRRATYATRLSVNIQKNAMTLLDSWENGFQEEFDGAGTENNSIYTSQILALSDVYAAMLYIDKITKDSKLEKAVGIGKCDNDVCLAALESQYAYYSKEGIMSNVVGLQKLYWGGATANEYYGFNDYLDSIDQTVLAKKIDQALITIMQSLQKITGSLRDSLGEDPSDGKNVYKAIKGLTDLLKGDFATLMQLTIPQDAAGDSD